MHGTVGDVALTDSKRDTSYFHDCVQPSIQHRWIVVPACSYIKVFSASRSYRLGFYKDK